jgi:Leucine-rich repeat (LRR) protein
MLKINNNELTKIENLENLKSLKDLDLSCNKIRLIDPYNKINYRFSF